MKSYFKTAAMFPTPATLLNFKLYNKQKKWMFFIHYFNHISVINWITSSTIANMEVLILLEQQSLILWTESC